jgi:hypothetical protein
MYYIIRAMTSSVVFTAVTSACGLPGCDVSEEYTASIFRVEE